MLVWNGYICQAELLVFAFKKKTVVDMVKIMWTVHCVVIHPDLSIDRLIADCEFVELP